MATKKPDRSMESAERVFEAIREKLRKNPDLCRERHTRRTDSPVMPADIDAIEARAKALRTFTPDRGFAPVFEFIRDDLPALIAALRARVALDTWIGPCAHGRDPWDRCETCGEGTAAEAIAAALHAATARAEAAEAEVVRLRAADAATTTLLRSAYDAMGRCEDAGPRLRTCAVCEHRVGHDDGCVLGNAVTVVGAELARRGGP